MTPSNPLSASRLMREPETGLKYALVAPGLMP